MPSKTAAEDPPSCAGGGAPGAQEAAVSLPPMAYIPQSTNHGLMAWRGEKGRAGEKGGVWKQVRGGSDAGHTALGDGRKRGAQSPESGMPAGPHGVL